MDEIKRWSGCCAQLLRDTERTIASAAGTEYREPFLGSEAGIGTHVRHMLDAYEQLLSGLGDGEIDYDRRRRSQELEVDLGRARAEISRLVSTLDRDLSGATDQPLRVRCDELEGPSGGWATSSLARELRFLVNHTVHHQAMIALILRVRGVEVPEDFGVAPSTLAHRRRV